MAVISRDKQEKSMILLMRIILIFLSISIIVGMILLNLPWYLSFIYPYGTILGVIFIVSGILINFKAIANLGLKYSPDAYEKIDELVTTGFYAYTRNPMYLGQVLITMGLFLIFPLTIFLIIVILFLFVLYSRAKKEEKQLSRKFGKKYIKYKVDVSFFVPNPIKLVKSYK